MRSSHFSFGASARVIGMCVARQAIHTSRPNISMPPSRWPITTIGLSSRVTVHMPSRAWKITTANVSSAARARSMLLQRNAAISRMASPISASALAVPCQPIMYSGMPAATSTQAVTTAVLPNRRLRVANRARVRISMPSAPARKRCTCSRQALCVSSGRISAAGCPMVSSTCCGQVACP
ncbi:hypothetical protein D3C72_1546110 [compost metagenome]